jgi:hypothetical protein
LALGRVGYVGATRSNCLCVRWWRIPTCGLSFYTQILLCGPRRSKACVLGLGRALRCCLFLRNGYRCYSRSALTTLGFVLRLRSSMTWLKSDAQTEDRVLELNCVCLLWSAVHPGPHLRGQVEQRQRRKGFSRNKRLWVL